MITPSTGASGTTLSLNGVASATTTADSFGGYSFTGLANGRYAVTPSNSGYNFSPTTQVVTISDADVNGVNFTAAAARPTYTISGTISPAPAGAGVTVNLGGAAISTTTADAFGNYLFSDLANGSYTVTPSKHRASFSPASLTVTIKDASAGEQNFTVSVRGSE